MKQLSFEKVGGWGGKRRGAGRKNRSGKQGHVKRESVDFRKPLHITLKFRKILSLRNRDGLQALRLAAVKAKRFSVNVIHYSIQNDHIHMIVEAKNSRCLANGMRSLCGSLGKRIRALVGGVGPVFFDRYHLHVLKNPTEMRRALEYVLLNTAKHMKVIEHIDSFCSGFAFKQWRELIGSRFRGLIRDQVEEFRCELPELGAAQSWLCRAGWMRSPTALLPRDFQSHHKSPWP